MKNSLKILAKIWLFYFLLCCLIFTLSKRSEGYYGYGGLGGVYGSSLYGGSSLSGLGGGLYSGLGGYGLGGLGMYGLGGYGGYGLGSSLYGGSSSGLGGYGLGSSLYGLGGLGMYGLGGLGGYGLGSSLYGGGLYSSLGGYGLGGIGMYGLGGYGSYGLGSSLYGGSSYGLGGYGLGGLGMYGLGGLGGYGLGSLLYGGSSSGLGSVGSLYYGNITGSPSNSGRAIYFGGSGGLYGGLSGGLGLTNPLLALSSLGGIAPAATAEQAGVWQGTWSAGFLFADMTLVIVENPTTGFLSGTVTLAGNFAIPTAVDVYGTATPYSIELSGIDPAGLYAVSINGILNSPTQMTGTWAIVKVSTGIVAKVLGVDQTGSFEVTLVNAPVFAPTAVAPAVIAPTVAPTAIAPTIIQPTTPPPLIVAPTVAFPTVFSPTIIAPTVISPTIIAPPIIAPTVIPPITSILPAAISGGFIYLALFGL